MRRILIVDDEPSVLDVLATLLTNEGHLVQTAPNGRVALDLLATGTPDLLITDVMMPGMDGWMLLATVREDLPALPVIVMSGVDPGADRLDVLSADHTLFLRKPFDIDTLLGSVERVVGSRSR
ncbi:MAG: two component transcriptional regulator, winged helix family [Thermomicrobiales bacterium]|nr:two component transcriptional regulator, winged helix family [Thermomicrobiales bacterium]